MKLHVKFRQGRRCNEGNCTAGQTEVVQPVPTIPAVQYKSIFDDSIGPDGPHSMITGTYPFDSSGTAATDGEGDPVQQRPGSLMLDEQLGWRTLSAQEQQLHDLPAGAWQVHV